jgi:tRNA N6-adenosine threonylcarbamoyltransferase
VAKLLGLGFPGGPAIDRLAAEGDPAAFDLPRPMLHQPGLDFSFSGLKTAVALALAGHGAPPYSPALTADLAASFQAAVIETLVAKSLRALAETGARALLLGGGVACNRGLRAALEAACASAGVALRIPSPRLCADNAAMVALIGAWSLERGDRPDPELDAVAALETSGLPIPRT